MKIRINRTEEKIEARALNDGEIALVDRSSTFAGALRFRVGNTVYKIDEVMNQIRPVLGPGDHVYTRVEPIKTITVEV